MNLPKSMQLVMPQKYFLPNKYLSVQNIRPTQHLSQQFRLLLTNQYTQLNFFC